MGSLKSRGFTGTGLGGGRLARSDFDEGDDDGAKPQPPPGDILAESGNTLTTESGDHLQQE
jgi:hypothetical protein